MLLDYVEPVLTEAAKGPRKGEIEQAMEEAEIRVIDGRPHWDVQGLIRMMIKLWGPMFSGRFEKNDRSKVRSLIGEANDIRNRHAHDMPFSYEDTYRDLDTIGRVSEAIGASETARKLREMAKAVIRVQFDEDRRNETRRTVAMEGTPLAALKPWREVVAPHSDVVKENFLEAEFVADLHAVHTGKATAEYGNPREFFARTFLTDGLKDLLRRSLNRLHGKGGSPVLELKTNFGGGKTHSLLALYHLFGDTPASSLAGMDSLLTELGISDSPKTKRVVIAGHQLGVNQPRKKADGTLVRTLWGEMAYQLGGSAAFEKIRSSDESGTNPGAEVLADVMRDAGPCLILIDEWVAYLRETVDVEGLAGGSLESNFGFAQSLTEAAKVVPHALAVASLPASQIEMGGPKGVAAYNQLSNLFQRVATPWQSTRTEEGYEIVRRRLFESHMEYPTHDKKQAGQKVKESAETVERRLGEAWCHILIPSTKDPASGKISWTEMADASGADKIASVLEKLRKKELVHDKFSAFYLKQALEKHLWGQHDHITTRAVADAFGTYLYFPRLLQDDLLSTAIRNGFHNLLCEFFGYAEAFDGNTGKYLGLCTTSAPFSVEIGESVLIKPDVATAKAMEAKSLGTPQPAGGSSGTGAGPEKTSGGKSGGSQPQPPAPVPKTRFYGSVEIPAQKVTSSVQKIVDEVVQHLAAKYGTKVKITLEVEAENAGGFDESLVRTVSENSNTLGFSEKGFE